MSNEFFTSSSVPANGSPGQAAVIRAEFEQVMAAFSKLPVMAGNSGKIITVDSTGTRIDCSNRLITDLLAWDSVGTFTGKTINWADNSISTIPIEGGGTGVTTLAAAKMVLGIDLKADATNAVLSGIPTAETAPLGTNTTRLATTQFVNAAINQLTLDAGAVVPGTLNPLADGVASPGTAAAYSREDHVHPADTSAMPIAGGTFSGTVSGPTPLTADNTTKLATTAWVRNAFPTIAVPTSQVTGLDAAIALKANINSPTFTGTPLLTTTPANGDSTKKIASTEFVSTAIALATAGNIGLTVGTVGQADGVAAVGTSGDAAHADHVHPHDTTKQNTITGAASSVVTADLTINRVVVTDASGKLSASATINTTELGYLNGVSGYIQTGIDSKQPFSDALTSISDAGLIGVGVLEHVGADVYSIRAIGQTGGLQVYDVDTAKIDVKQTFTAQQAPKSGTLTDAATVAFNADTTGNVISLLMTSAVGASRAMGVPSNIMPGAMYLMRIKQDAVGSRTLTWNTTYYKFGTAGAPVLSTGANKVDYISFVGAAGNVLECLGVRLDAVT